MLNDKIKYFSTEYQKLNENIEKDLESNDIIRINNFL